MIDDPLVAKKPPAIFALGNVILLATKLYNLQAHAVDHKHIFVVLKKNRPGTEATPACKEVENRRVYFTSVTNR